MKAWLALAGALLAMSVSSGCVGVFAADHSSSIGSSSKGALLHGVAMPFAGSGYEIPSDWRARGHRYTTLINARWLADVFREVDRKFPGSIAYLGDLSAKAGGDSTQHHSHASGRDVDVFYFACDSTGRAIRDLPAMLHFAPDGRALRWSVGRVGQVLKSPPPDARFDVRRNWMLVQAMLEMPSVEVQWIFVQRDFAVALLAEGVRQGASPATLARAQELIHQPTDSQPHDDHMHVRLFCDASDRAMGCSDKGPKRWLKKNWKYMRPAEQMLASRDRG
jgi:penicillin-insensitive murein DD-endopeptidase